MQSQNAQKEKIKLRHYPGPNPGPRAPGPQQFRKIDPTSLGATL
jgi:hypothetical protein